jgi:hypothetical protein
MGAQSRIESRLMLTTIDNQDAYQLGQAMARVGRERKTEIGCGDPDCAECAAIRASFFMGYDAFKANPTVEEETA